MVYKGKPYEQMDDLGGVKTAIFGSTPSLCPMARPEGGGKGQLRKTPPTAIVMFCLDSWHLVQPMCLEIIAPGVSCFAP